MAYLVEILKARSHPPKDTRPSMTDRTVIITGANTGVGYEAAFKFVQLGAKKVILAVRTISKGEEAARQIEEKAGRKGVCDVWLLDMLDYATIKEFAARVNRELDRLDYVILNAGVVMATYKKSSYGNEQTMQVNVLSTTYLALLLLPKLKESKTSTFTPVLEIVGSGNQYVVHELPSESTPFTSYNEEKGFAGPQVQYSVSKLFVMYVQTALVELVGPGKDADTYVTVICPGPTASNLARDITAWYFQLPLWLFEKLVQRKTEAGARTYITAVAEGEKTHGKFFKDDVVREAAPLMIGEKGAKLQAIVWKEIIDTLKKDVPDVEKLIQGRSAARL